MNRSQRRAAQFKRGQQWNRNDVFSQPAATWVLLKRSDLWAQNIAASTRAAGVNAASTRAAKNDATASCPANS